MKKVISIAALAAWGAFGSSAAAQQQAQADTTQSDGFLNLYAGIYSLSKQFADDAVARIALYHLLITTPNKTAILDSLALSYYNDQDWISVVLVSTENLKINPDNELALELSGVAYENLGLKDKALDQYETLFLKNDETSTLYRVAFLQYEQKRYKESLASVDILLNRADIEGQKLYFPKVDKTQQEVSMRGALLNLKGLIAKAEGNITQAKEYYIEALKASPGFELAQRNLSDADK